MGRELPNRRLAQLNIDERGLLDLLQLPDGYRVRSVIVDQKRLIVQVIVESDDLPEVLPLQDPPIAQHVITVHRHVCDDGSEWFRKEPTEVWVPTSHVVT